MSIDDDVSGFGRKYVDDDRSTLLAWARGDPHKKRHCQGSRWSGQLVQTLGPFKMKLLTSWTVRADTWPVQIQFEPSGSLIQSLFHVWDCGSYSDTKERYKSTSRSLWHLWVVISRCHNGVIVKQWYYYQCDGGYLREEMCCPHGPILVLLKIRLLCSDIHYKPASSNPGPGLLVQTVHPISWTVTGSPSKTLDRPDQ